MSFEYARVHLREEPDPLVAILSADDDGYHWRCEPRSDENDLLASILDKIANPSDVGVVGDPIKTAVKKAMCQREVRCELTPLVEMPPGTVY